jgi:hypothetical protein
LEFEFTDEEKGLHTITYSLEYEEFLAAIWAGFPGGDLNKSYQKLDGNSKSRVIAAYRNTELLASVRAALSTRDSKNRPPGQD